MQVVTGSTVYIVTQLQVAAQGRAAQIQVAVFHTQFVTTIGFFFDSEWRYSRFVQDGIFRYFNFNITRW
ncbi:hypothetical protein D3C80_1875380 [compost metagenome]